MAETRSRLKLAAKKLAQSCHVHPNRKHDLCSTFEQSASLNHSVLIIVMAMFKDLYMTAGVEGDLK